MAITPTLRADHFELADHLYTLVPRRGEQRITVRHQQVRALNLALLLARDTEAKRVCVIGGGAAGLTFAAAWSRLCEGGNVRVLERLEHVLGNLRGCRSRFLHPNLFSWPRPGWHDPDARLPFMNWQAGVAHTVYERFHAQQALESVEAPVKVTRVQPAATGIDVEWSSHSGSEHGQRFDAAVLAIGPGLERQSRGSSGLSYWHADNLDRADPNCGDRARELVIAGTGDGGLTDFLRAVFVEFVDHCNLANIVEGLQEHEVAPLRAVLEANSSEAETARAFETLACALDRDAFPRIRERVRARLIGSSPKPYSQRSAFPINRLLTAAVLQRADLCSERFSYTMGVVTKAVTDHGDETAQDRWVLVKDVEGNEHRAFPADEFVARIGVQWNDSKTLDFAHPVPLQWPKVEISEQLALRRPQLIAHDARLLKVDRITVGASQMVGDPRTSLVVGSAAFAREHGVAAGEGQVVWDPAGGQLRYLVQGDTNTRELPRTAVVVLRFKPHAEDQDPPQCLLMPKFVPAKLLHRNYCEDTETAFRLWGALSSGIRLIVGGGLAPSQRELNNWLSYTAPFSAVKGSESGPIHWCAPEDHDVPMVSAGHNGGAVLEIEWLGGEQLPL